MEIKALKSVVIFFLRIIAKIKFKERVISIFDVIVGTRSILIVMPNKLDDFGIARNYIRVIQNNFPKAKLTLVLRDQYRNLLDKSERYGTIFVTSKDKNILGLPKNTIVGKVTKKTYDITIDMNHTFHLFSTYLCQKSGAQLKICLADNEREPFYNFSVRTPVSDKLGDKYRNMFRYLSPNISEFAKRS